MWCFGFGVECFQEDPNKDVRSIRHSQSRTAYIGHEVGFRLSGLGFRVSVFAAPQPCPTA